MSKGVQRVKQELDDICSIGCFKSEGGATPEENMEGGEVRDNEEIVVSIY